MDDLMLPPLPEPYQIWETWGQNVDVFTAEQMREYAKKAVEACAEVCDEEICHCCYSEEEKAVAEHLATTIRARTLN